MIANKYFSVLLAFASVAFGAAPYHRINQCKTEDCATDCPGYLDVDIPGDADGLGILDAPQCTVYYNSFPDWPHDESGKAIVYHDVSQPDEGCAYILLSPANVDDYACGVRVGEFRNPVCVRTLLSSTWMFERCCGQACDLSSKRDNIRGANWLGEQSFPRNDLTGSLHAMKLYHNDEAVTPHSERAAVYRRKISRRDCSGYTEERRYVTYGYRGTNIGGEWKLGT